MTHRFVQWAAFFAFLAVALGAFGAHGLKGHLSENDLSVYKTAVEYQMWHALGLGFIGLLQERLPQSKILNWSGWLMFFGILIFSGSLYALTLTGIRSFGMLTPFGGLSFLIAWLLVALGVSKQR